MQHLDEGTIHAWLDGALTPEEAARADAHVKECAQCQAAVAEARGFIAASSRILTALDDAPRGVIPAAATRRSVQPWVWRVAATVVVVVGATALLVKDRGGDRTTMSGRISAHVPDTTQPSMAAGAAAASSIVAGPVAADSVARREPPVAPMAIPPRAAAKLDARAGNAGRRTTGEERVGVAGGQANVGDRRPDVAEASPSSAAPPINAPSPMAARTLAAANGVVAPESPPREIVTRHLLGKTQTFYEISPGDTVMLEEQVPVSLQGRVISGAASTGIQVQPSRVRTNAAVAPETQQKTAATAAPAPATAALQDATTQGRHSISWLDPSTRQVVVLSGQHSQEELETIRRQIQLLRDAAQSKRSPE